MTVCTQRGNKLTCSISRPSIATYIHTYTDVSCPCRSFVGRIRRFGDSQNHNQQLSMRMVHTPRHIHSVSGPCMYVQYSGVHTCTYTVITTPISCRADSLVQRKAHNSKQLQQLSTESNNNDTRSTRNRSSCSCSPRP
jgi:hypothetical protein